jgi:hypothetical protein
VLDLGALDLDAIAEALADQTNDDQRVLIDPQTGQTVRWTRATGVDGQHPVPIAELGLVCIEPLPSYVWHRDMADFAESVTDQQAGRRLLGTIQGSEAFRQFRDELRKQDAGLVPAWYAFLETRARRRAVDWLAGQLLITAETARQFRAGHPDPAVP